MKKQTKGQKSKSASKVVPRIVGCECEKNLDIEPHACPFQQDVYGSMDEEYCRCCDYCKSNCANNI